MFPQYPIYVPTMLCCTSLWEVKPSTTTTIYCLHPLPLLFYCLHQHNFTISGNSCLERWKLLINFITRTLGFPGNSVGEESVCNAGDLGLIPGSGRLPGEGKGYYPLQCSCLENSKTEKPGGLQSMGLQIVGHDWATKPSPLPPPPPGPYQENHQLLNRNHQPIVYTPKLFEPLSSKSSPTRSTSLKLLHCDPGPSSSKDPL